MITLSISLILTVTAVVSYAPAMKQQHVANAYNTTLMALRRAHDAASADMRVYVVSFATPGTITVTQTTTSGTLFFTSTLPQDVTFHVEPGVPTSPTVAPTTPDGFGSAGYTFDFDQGVGAGGGSTIYFQPDGSALDAAGNVNNGIVYFGMPGDLYSSRAITLWGTTSRIRGWRLYKNGSGVIWRQQ